MHGRARLRGQLEGLEAQLATAKAKKCGLAYRKCKKDRLAEVAKIEGLIKAVKGVLAMRA